MGLRININVSDEERLERIKRHLAIIAEGYCANNDELAEPGIIVTNDIPTERTLIGIQVGIARELIYKGADCLEAGKLSGMFKADKISAKLVKKTAEGVEKIKTT